MKIACLYLMFPFSVAIARADILSNLSPYLNSSRPDYDPSAFEPDLSEMNPRYAPFSSADSDLGVQQLLNSYDGLPPVEFYFKTSINYTDNIPDINPDTNTSAWLWAGQFDVNWSPLVGNGWYLDAGLGQGIYRYEGSAPGDFENFDTHLGLVKSIPDLDDLLFFVRYEFQRITADSLSESNYSAHRIRTGFRKDLLLSSRYQLSAGVDVAFDLSAKLTRRERNQYSADVKYTYWFSDKVNSTLFWNGSFWDFNNTEREDVSHTFGLELTWTPTQDLSIFSNVFYTNHNSNTFSGFNDFDSLQVGLGFGVNFSF